MAAEIARRARCGDGSRSGLANRLRRALALGPAGQVELEAAVAAVVAQIETGFQGGSRRRWASGEALLARADAQAGAQLKR